MSSRFEIPRSPEFNWTDLSPHAKGFKFLRSDPDSALVISINPAQLEIKVLFETPPPIHDVNEVIETNLCRLKNEGYVFLDAYVCRFLFQNNHLFPKEWCEITESESLDEKSGSIRFDGSIFSSPTQEVVLSPFCSRGKWGHGFNYNRVSDVEAFKMGSFSSRSYTAVLHRKYLDADY